MSRTLNNDTTDDAGYLQGVPISTTPPAPNDVLQYINTTGVWTPEPVEALPSIMSIQNVGVGAGIWSNTTAGVASLKSLDSGTGIIITSNSTDITINSVPTPIITPQYIPNATSPITGVSNTFYYTNDDTILHPLMIGAPVTIDLPANPHNGDLIIYVHGATTTSANIMCDSNAIFAGINTSLQSGPSVGIHPYNNSTIQSEPLGASIELMCISSINGGDSQNIWQSVNSNTNWQSDDGVDVAISQVLSNLMDVTLTSPALNDVLTYNGTDWINQPVPTPSSSNIYNTDGTLTGNRTVTLAGNTLVFGPIAPTSPAQLFLNPGLSEIGLFSYNGEVNIGDTTQTTTNIESGAVNVVGGIGGISINSASVNFPQQASGVLKTTLGSLTANANLEDLADVNVTSIQNKQLISYDIPSSKWLNINGYIYRSNQSLSNVTFTAALDTIYISAGCTITLPSVGSSDFGRRIMISASQLQQTTIIFPNGIYLVYNNTSYTNFQMNNPTGTVEVIVTGSDEYTFSSITDRWGSAILSFQPFTASMLNLNDLQDAIITSPVANQILKYNGADWVNSSTTFASNLLYSGIILSGSTLQHIYDYVTIMDITYTANASVNMTITMSAYDSNDSSAMVWDIMDYINDNTGTFKYIQPRTTNNWAFYTYFLYILNDVSTINKFYIVFQKGPSSNPLSTNTGGYYFNFYNYGSPAAYTYNIYPSPSYVTGTGVLGTVQTAPRQQIFNFSGTNIVSSPLTFNYGNRLNYNIRFQIWTEINLTTMTTGTFNVLLNGVNIYTTGYQTLGPGASTTTNSINICDFGDAMTLLSAGTLFPSTNILTFTASTGTTTSCNYTVSVIVSL